MLLAWRFSCKRLYRSYPILKAAGLSSSGPPQAHLASKKAKPRSGFRVTQLTQ